MHIGTTSVVTQTFCDRAGVHGPLSHGDGAGENTGPVTVFFDQGATRPARAEARYRPVMEQSTPRYTGHVEKADGPSYRHTGDVTIGKLSVGPVDNNAYLVLDRPSGEAVLIDAANDADRILALLDEQVPPIRLTVIITTHRHQDHWQALAAVAARTGAPVAAGEADADALPVPVAIRLTHGDRIPLGPATLEVIALRGHTPGSVAVQYRDAVGRVHLFTGDSLFPGGPGKTANPADFTSLMDDLESRVFGALPDDTRVYPGHGDDTTLGAERPHLAEWRARGW